MILRPVTRVGASGCQIEGLFFGTLVVPWWGIVFYPKACHRSSYDILLSQFNDAELHLAHQATSFATGLVAPEIIPYDVKKVKDAGFVEAPDVSERALGQMTLF